MKPTSNKEDNPKKDWDSKAKRPFRGSDHKQARPQYIERAKKEGGGSDFKRSTGGSRNESKFAGKQKKEDSSKAFFNHKGKASRETEQPYQTKKRRDGFADKSHKGPKKGDVGNKKSWEKGSDRFKDASLPQKKKNFKTFENDDLSFGKKDKTQNFKPAEKPVDEITFSKSIEKWEVEKVPLPYGKIEERLGRKSGKEGRFRQKFDDERPQEKVYSQYSTSAKSNKDDYVSEKTLQGEMPLNKYIAHCGVCSRRDAVALIKEGKVKVNGELVVEPGHKVTVNDRVTLSGKKIDVQKNLIYILLNKPQGYITTTDDPKGRNTVLDIFKNEVEERIFPVGRLDRNTTGLLLLTNDGELTQKLSHPKYEVRKVYKVILNKNVSIEDFNRIKEGIVLEDGPAPVDQIEYLDKKSEIGLEIHSGKNRIVRRIFESLGYVVERLDRVMYAGLTKKNLPRGKWRFLSKQEVINLKYLK